MKGLFLAWQLVPEVPGAPIFSFVRGDNAMSCPQGCESLIRRITELIELKVLCKLRV